MRSIFEKRECPEIKEKFVWPTSLKQHYNLAKRGKGLAEFYQIGQVLFGLWEVIPGHHVTIKSYLRKCLNPPWLSQTVAQMKNLFVFLKISNNYALFNFIASIGIGCILEEAEWGFNIHLWSLPIVLFRQILSIHYKCYLIRFNA